jgi:hypothetical protein
LVGHFNLTLDAEFENEDENCRIERNTIATWVYMWPTIWEGMKQESNFWCTRMEYFHKHRRCYPIRNYDVKSYHIKINHIDTKKDIRIVKYMKKWETAKTINMLQVINANIQDPILNELFIRNPTMIEEIDQFETFLPPIEIDDLPCKPSDWIEDSKERRLRLLKVQQISFNCKWTINPDKILTPAALQIFYNIHNASKFINEAYQKE